MIYVAYISLFLLLLFNVLDVQSACYKDTVNYFEGSCSIKISQRPGSNLYDLLPEYNEKLEPKKPGEKSIVLTRHHVIPFNTLRDFHNKLAESKTGDANKVRRFFMAYKAQYQKYFEKRGKEKCKNKPKNCMDKYDQEIRNLQKFVTGFYEGKMTFKQNGGTAEGFDNYQEFYVWLPGNLFVGPNDRTDDPGEGFEKGAQTIIGTTMFSYYKSAYEEMEKYAKTGNADFNKLANSLVQITGSRLEPYPLLASQWNIKGSKKYSIK